MLLYSTAIYNSFKRAPLFIIWRSIIIHSTVSTPEPQPLLFLSCPSLRAQKHHFSIQMRHIRLKNTLNVNINPRATGRRKASVKFGKKDFFKFPIQWEKTRLVLFFSTFCLYFALCLCTYIYACLFEIPCA